MHNLPFDKPGRFWRGNLHTHSTLSDGADTPEAICGAYREVGYDFISLTEHFMERYAYPIADTLPYRTDGFTTILGAELHAGQIGNGTVWHILAVGLPANFPTPPAGETGPQIAQRAIAAGAFVAVAHPSWYSLAEADVLSLGPVHAVEIFNGIAGGDNDRSDSWPLLNVLLNRGHRYFACAADDAHRKPGYTDFCQGWVQVKAAENSPDALLAALKAGHFYSSTGPQIHDVQVTPGQRVTVSCSPAERIFVTGCDRQSRRAWGEGLTEATFDISEINSPYLRVTVRDSQGKRAWTNPVWFV
ncbi:MAG: CehA/McbA family metallohydrolase [Chloroflexi bacterium]|nr:CehA/McbA family metallohydrolase [Chloroflexota bacterium]